MITRYTLFNIGLFLAFSTLLVVVFFALDLEGNSGVSVAMTMVSAMLIGQLFVKEQKRTFTKKERYQLAAAFTLAGMVASTALVALIWLLLEGTELLVEFLAIIGEMASLMVVVTLVVLLLLYGVTWLGLGLGAKAALKQQSAKSTVNRD